MKLSKYFDTDTEPVLITVKNPTDKQIENFKYTCESADEIREYAGVLVATSGLRPKKSSYSQHQDGMAMDFVPKSMNIKKVFEYIRFRMLFDQIILEKNKNGNRWIHFSIRKDGKNRKMALLGYWDEETKQMEYKSA